MRARCRGQSRGRPSSRLGGGKSVRAERSGRRPRSRSAMSRDGRLRSRPFDSGLRPALRANGGGKTAVGNPFALSAAAAGRGVEAPRREMVVCHPGPSTPAFGLRSGRTVVGKTRGLQNHRPIAQVGRFANPETGMGTSLPGITIVGGGLVGALLAALLAQRGFAVDVFERRPDPRKAGYAGGRSINLALAERGLHGLRLAGLTDEVMRLAVMMRGRMVHHRDGHTELLRYGRDDSEVIWSISRGRLNIALIDAAERAGARFHFDRRLAAADFGEQVTLRFVDDAGGGTHAHVAAFAIGADGAGSSLRAAMNAVAPLGERIEELGHGYKELEIPPRPGPS